MSLRTKTLVIIGTTLFSLFLALLIFSRMIFLDSFVRLEEDSVRRNIDRAINALQDDIAVIHTTDRDWAHWTDTYNFIHDLNDNYREGNTHDGIFTSYQLNFMLFVDTDGEVAFGKAFDLKAQQEVPISESLLDQLELDGLLLNHKDEAGELNISGVSGILMLPEGPVIIASSPILTTERKGPARGSIIWGRYLDDLEVASVAERTRLSLTVHRLDNPQLSDDFQNAGQSMLEVGMDVIQPLDAERVAGYTMLEDIYGNAALILRIDMPRAIYAQGNASISYFALSLLVIGLVFASATLVLLEKVVLSRLAYLDASVSKIRKSTDLSARINLTGKDELSSLANSINEMLAALTIAHRNVEQARDQALEALNLKAQILANVSHDARTPLNVITLKAEMLQRGLYGPVTPDQIKVFDTILINANQLLFFVNNLLEQAQLEAGKVKLHTINFAPSNLLGDIEASMLSLAARRGLRLETELSEDVPPYLHGDPDRLNQIVSNLVNNAIKFTDEGCIKVSVIRPDETHWGLQVSDTGPGIPTEAKERIFEAFWQVDGSHSRKVGRGAGLGLSIVSQLVNLMDGTVSVESHVGMGSTFTVVLPLEESRGENVHEHALRINS